MSQRDRVIVVCRSSECFADEVAYAAAASHWPRSFWKALDRLFAGGVLMNCPADFQWEGN